MSERKIELRRVASQCQSERYYQCSKSRVSLTPKANLSRTPNPTVDSKDQCILTLYILTPNSIKNPATIRYVLGGLHSPMSGDL